MIYLFNSLLNANSIYYFSPPYIMGKPKRTKNRKKKAKKHNPIALLAIGEGPRKGRVYRAAKRLADKKSQKRIVVLDLKKPEYKPPATMQYIRRDAAKFLSSVAPSTFEKIYDKYCLNFITLGKLGRNPEAFNRAKRAQAVVRIAKLGGDIRPNNKLAVDTDANMRRYARSALRALVPGGKFVILTGIEKYKNRILESLLAAGFEVRKVHKLSPAAIERSGSTQALSDHKHGVPVYRIHAVKPEKA